MIDRTCAKFPLSIVSVSIILGSYSWIQIPIDSTYLVPRTCRGYDSGNGVVSPIWPGRDVVDAYNVGLVRRRTCPDLRDQ
jgi:hypothetical protein